MFEDQLESFFRHLLSDFSRNLDNLIAIDFGIGIL